MGKPSLVLQSLPAPVEKAVKELGLNMHIARLRRRQTLEELAERTMLSAPTLRRIERGDPSVSIANYFAALWALDLIAAVRNIASPKEDAAAQLLDLEKLPKRVRHVNRPR